MTMRPYWIAVEGRLGVGVTAQDEREALILAAPALTLYGSPEVQSVKAVLSIDELDQGHVVPNMGMWLRRGIWYPRGLD